MTQFSISRSTLASRIAGLVALGLFAALAAAPWWASSSFLHLAGEFAVYLALATLWNLLAGYTGLVSVGQQAYVGLGGYITFSLALFLGCILCWPFLWRGWLQPWSPFQWPLWSFVWQGPISP